MPEIKDWRTKRERYQLFGSECKKCNTKFFPRKKICRECRNEDMITVTLDVINTMVLKVAMGILNFEPQ